MSFKKDLLREWNEDINILKDELEEIDSNIKDLEYQVEDWKDEKWVKEREIEDLEYKISQLKGELKL